MQLPKRVDSALFSSVTLTSFDCARKLGRPLAQPGFATSMTERLAFDDCAKGLGFGIWTRAVARFATSARCRGFVRLRFHRRGPRFGFVLTRMGTSKPPGAMHEDANSIGTTRCGRPRATRTSTDGSSSSRDSSPSFAPIACAMLGALGWSAKRYSAAMLRIVDLTSIRVGNEEYSRTNDSFGLTTLRVRHARVRGHVVEFKYRGKSGVLRHLIFRDARLARLIADCRALRGKQLFQYVDEFGIARPVRSQDLNAYLRTLTATHYSIKDFRTWSATVRAARELKAIGVATTQRATKKLVLEAVRRVADHLGNTPAVCRKSYIHPGLLDASTAGSPLPPEPSRGATAAAKYELVVLAFLEGLTATKLNARRSQLARAS